MRMAVCMKHVVDTTEIRFDKKSGGLILSGIPTKISDYDRHAIEEAVRIKEKLGGEVIIFTVGPKEAFKTVKEALAMGCDTGYIIQIDSLLNTDKFKIFFDPLTIAEILFKAIDKLGQFDLILCGEVSEDGYNAQVGPALAEFLNLPHVAYATRIDINSDTAKVEALYEETTEFVDVQLPAVITVTRLINTPRLPTLLQVMKVPKNKVIFWRLDEVGLSEEEIKDRVYTNLVSYSELKTERKSIIIEGEPEETAKQLVEKLKEEGVL